MAELTHLLAQRAHEVQASAIREICKLIAKPQIRSLAGGWPDPATFPVADLQRIATDIFQQKPALALQYTTSEGLPELREFLADWLGKKEGIHCTPDELLITHGFSQGMELTAKIFIEAGDVAFVGLPTYFGGSGACQTFGAELVGVELDADGMIPDLLEEKILAAKKAGKRPKLLYVIPDFQNPSGVTMPLARRQRLVELAQQHDLVIAEDSPYRDLRYSGEAVPPLMSLEPSGRVVYLKSFSKVFCPGFRLAVVVGDADVIRRMVIARQFEDCCTAAFGQYLLYEFCRQGLLDRQIKLNCAIYTRKRDCMLQALDQHMPTEVQWNRPDGGFFVFVHLPAGMDAEELLHEAVDHDVAFVAGAPFYVDGSGSQTLRLSFAQSEPAVIEAAVAELGALLKAKM